MTACPSAGPWQRLPTQQFIAEPPVVAKRQMDDFNSTPTGSFSSYHHVTVTPTTTRTPTPTQTVTSFCTAMEQRRTALVTTAPHQGARGAGGRWCWTTTRGRVVLAADGAGRPPGGAWCWCPMHAGSIYTFCCPNLYASHLAKGLVADEFGHPRPLR